MRTLGLGRAVRTLRAINEDSLPHRATIRKPGPVVNGEPSAPVVVDTDVPCRMRPAGTVDERVVADTLDAPARFQVTFAVGTQIAIDYELTVTGQDEVTGDAFTQAVKVVGDADGGRGRTMRKVLAEALP